jgi:hypothetical protein
MSKSSITNDEFESKKLSVIKHIKKTRKLTDDFKQKIDTQNVLDVSSIVLDHIRENMNKLFINKSIHFNIRCLPLHLQHCLKDPQSAICWDIIRRLENDEINVICRDFHINTGLVISLKNPEI